MKKVVVIGGGIIGLCSAYYLSKEGYAVTVIDKEELSQGASNINAGYIAPSHILSLASPGMINKGLKWMWNESSPFYIKPRWDIDFIDWAWKFKKSATKSKVNRSVPILKELLAKSQNLYEEILQSVDFNVHYEKKGLLTVYKSPSSAKEEIAKGKKIETEGIAVNFLNQQEILKLQPSLSKDVTGGVHYVENSHVTPNYFMKSFYNYLKKHGVEFKLNEEVTDIHFEKDKITGIRTNRGLHTADEYVLCAGSWSGHIAKILNLRISLQGGKGYCIDNFHDNKISIPTILSEPKVAVTPMDGFTRFAGTMEFSGQNSIIRTKRVEAIVKAALSYYEDVKFTEKEIRNVKSGLRPVSPDGLPYIGRPERFDNLIIAAGHAMIGWSLGPITGKIVSQLLTANNPDVDITPFSLNRKFS